MSAADTARRWSSIMSAATLGTNRAAFSPPALWPDAAIAIPADKPERMLLRLAAMSYLWQVSGTRAASARLSDPDPPDTDRVPAADDEPPGETAGKSVTAEKLVSEAAAWRLCRMLNGEHRELVPEWFALARGAGAVLPPHWLPVVLEAMPAQERLGLKAVLGKRAVWLAQRNPAWRLEVSSAAPSEDRWMNGTLAQRRAQLAALRALDPAKARDWIASTWKVDPPEAREEFIRTLLIGLTGDDEPLLESALDDKRKAVRSAAADCLARLPESAHARRNHDRVQSLLVLEPASSGILGRLRKRRLEVQLPTSLEKDAVRDGIDPNPPAQRKIGERAYWLMQMVSMVRPSYWPARFDCDVETFIAAVLATEYARDLLLSLSEATIRHRDVDWISPLCTRWLELWNHRPDGREPSHGAANAPVTIASLLAEAPVAKQEEVVRKLLGSLDTSRFDLVNVLLGSIGGWSAQTTRSALEILGERVRTDHGPGKYPRNTLTEWGRRAEVSVASSGLADLHARCPPDSSWRNAIEAMNEMIDFRSSMTQELRT